MHIFMPPAKTIHYKCAFDIKEDIDTVKNIKNIINEWCRRRRDFKQNEHDSILRDWFLYGDQEQHVFGKCYIKTALNKGEYTKENPQHWAFELIHQDSKYSFRLWCTNISISRINNNTIRFACLLSHALQPYYLGDEPDVPSLSVPKFVKNIVTNNNIYCSKNKIKIEGTCYDVAVFGSQWLASVICDKERVIPIIISVNLSNREDYDTITESIHKNNIGNANTYKITDTESLSTFNSVVPYDHRLSDGMIRIFLRFKDIPNSGHFHRFYTYDQVEEKKEDIVNEITCAISRRSSTFYPEEIISIKDVIDKRRLNNIEELKNNINYDKNEYIKLLEYELEEKNKEIKDKNEYSALEQEQFENKILELSVLLDEKKELCKKLQYEANQYPILSSKIAKLEAQQTNNIDFSLPESLLDVLSLSEYIHKNHIIIHENAKRSANNYSGCSNIKIMVEAWRMLSRLNDIMYELKFIHNSNELEKSFFEKTAIKFSMTESSTTKSDKNFIKLRTCVYESDGKLSEIKFFPHLKSSIRDDFRLHFSFLEEEKKNISLPLWTPY